MCKTPTLKKTEKLVFKTNYGLKQVKSIAKIEKLIFKTNYCLMQVKSIAECSKGSILQYFQPSLSYHLSLRSLLSIFERPFYTGLPGKFSNIWNIFLLVLK